MRFFSITAMILVLMTIPCLVSPVCAFEKETIIVGGDHENPPYEFVKDGKATGFNVELMQAVADAIGAKVEFRLGPWGEVRKELEEGKIDALAGMYYSEKRSKLVDFSVFHTMVSAGLFVRDGSPIRSIEDIKGKEVIVQKGDVIDDYLREKGITSRIIEVKDPADVLRLLASGMHDCAVMPSRFQGEYLKGTLGIAHVRGINAGLPQFRYCFAVRKGNGPLRYRLDEGLNILKLNGKYQEIYDKWFGVYEKSRLWRTLRYFVWALVVISGLLAANFIWSWVLHREVRKRTADLRESEGRLRTLVQTLPDLVWLKDKNGIYLSCNPMFERLYNAPEADIIGKTDYDFVDRELADFFIMNDRKAIAAGKPTINEEWLTFADDGHRALVETIKTPVYDVAGGLIGVLGIGRDITQRKQAEDELRESEEKFRVLADTSPVAICLIQGERHVYVNQTMLDRSGYSEREFMETSFWGFIHEEYRSLVMERGLARQRGEPVPSPYEIKWLTKKGEEKWALLSAGRIEYKGTPAIIATLFDITDRKLMEDKLREAHDELEIRVEERTAELAKTVEALQLSQFCIDNAGIGIYHTDENGKIFNVNKHACMSLGYSKEELCALSVFDIDPEITRERILELKEIIDEKGSMTHFTTHKRKDGSTFPVEITTNHLEFHGTRYGVSFVKDITRRKRAEEALKESESRVRRKLESILDPEGDIGELELADIIDLPQIQALMDDLYRAAGLKMSILDPKGEALLIDVGWQEICRKYHRGHPETRQRCRESDTDMTFGIRPGEFRKYKCKNNMWHLVTPIFVGGRHMGNLFISQFFFEDEKIDYEIFRTQARKFGFPEEDYLAALEAVPRYSEGFVDLGKALFLRLIDMFSMLSYGNIKLARLLAERDRLAENLQQANLVVEHSPVVLFRCKAAPGWPVELVSKNVVQFGYTPEEFLSGGLTYSSIVYEGDLGKLISETEEFSVAGEGNWSQEYRIVTKDGDIRWIVDQTVCERDEKGEITHYEGVIIDVTERRKAEEKLIVQQHQLKELNSTLEERVRLEVAKNREKDFMLIQQNRQAAMGEILDHVAHQWKQPLYSISLISYLLKDNNSLKMEEVNETVDKIHSQVDFLSQTLNDFRDFYRPDKEKKLFQVKESMDRAFYFLMSALQFESVKVDIQIATGLTAYGFPKEYTQVVLNLVGNARDVFKERKVENPKLIVRGFAEGETAVVTVTDNAGGISEENINSIFDMNFTTKGSIGGTGIGLHMSRNIIEQHMGGLLTVENVDGGARFTIRLASTGPLPGEKDAAGSVANDRSESATLT